MKPELSKKVGPASWNDRETLQLARLWATVVHYSTHFSEIWKQKCSEWKIILMKTSKKWKLRFSCNNLVVTVRLAAFLNQNKDFMDQFYWRTTTGIQNCNSHGHFESCFGEVGGVFSLRDLFFWKVRVPIRLSYDYYVTTVIHERYFPPTYIHVKVHFFKVRTICWIYCSIRLQHFSAMYYYVTMELL